MCSLDFFFKPQEGTSFFSEFFNFGDFRGISCKGSTEQRRETMMLLMVTYGVCAILAFILCYFTNKALKQGQALAMKCDYLERAIIEYDEFCAKRGIRGRAETFVSACTEGFFLDLATTSAWLSVNHLEANIEQVDNADHADLLPMGDDLVEIEQMRREFINIVRKMERENRLPEDYENMMDEQLEPEGAPPAPTPHQLISARMDPTPSAAASRQRSVDAIVTTGLVATTPPPEPQVPTAAAPAAAAAAA
ncbi:hypothetical protein PMAYCL1PPCAC_24599, partial [Pristionchus mayeri]